MPLTNAEIDAVIMVLWHTHAIRSTYEDRALFEDEVNWKNRGGFPLFPNFFRYNSQKWKDIMGPDDPTVRGRRISRSAMVHARRDFELSYREPVILALGLADRVRQVVAEAIEKNGPSEDGDYEEEVGMKAWTKVVSDPSVRKQIAELAKQQYGVEASSFQI